MTNCSQNHDHDHDHHHGGMLETILFFVGLITFIIGLFVNITTVKYSLYFLTFLLSGYHIIIEGFIDTFQQTIKHKRFKPNIHILMTLAAVGAMIIGEFMEAALLILIFAGAHYLEDYTQNKSKKEITSLLELHPTTARKIMPNGDVKIVNVDQLQVGDYVSILNGDQIPTDGTVISGTSAIDEASITGESIPVEKTKGDTLFGSTINGSGSLMMEVTKDSSETVFAKIVELVSQTQTNISKTAALIKRIEPVYVTIVLILAPLFYLAGLYLFDWGTYDSFYRTMVFLIATSPCALAVTDIPATLSAISHLAKRGVLFKGGSYLSNLSDLSAVAFDKTGTLTKCKPVVTDTYFIPSLSSEEISQFEEIIVSMESNSNHPLANAIIEHYPHVEKQVIETENVIGVGLVAKDENNTYSIGKPSSIDQIPDDIHQVTEQFEANGKTVVYFTQNELIKGLIAIQDITKDTSKAAVQYFNKNDIETVMITGDAERTGKAIANQLSIKTVYGNVMPEEKASIITEIKESHSTVAMIGDGVNDAPALVTSDVGVAMGEG